MAITVSSPEMAAVFAAAGWRDITIAIPLNPNCASIYERLASKCRLNLLTDSAEAVEALATRMHAPVGVWIEIDSGDHRTGLDPEDQNAVIRTADRIRATVYEKVGVESAAQVASLVAELRALRSV